MLSTAPPGYIRSCASSSNTIFPLPGGNSFIGLGGCTNGAGIDQVRDLLEPLGARVHAVPCDRALHLKSAVTALPDGWMLGWGPVIPSEGLPPVMAMPEEPGAHVVDLGDGRVLMAASAPLPASTLITRIAEIAARRADKTPARPAPFYVRPADAAPPRDPAPVILD